MTCSILSAIIANTKVTNWARNPGWRIAANERFAGAGGAAVSLGWMFKGGRFQGERRPPRGCGTRRGLAYHCSWHRSRQPPTDDAAGRLCKNAPFLLIVI